MKIVSLPEKIKGIIFDIDLTLYDSKAYYNSQLDLLIMELARVSGKTFDGMVMEIESYRKDYAFSHGGRRPALGQVFLRFGVTIERNCEWRTRLFRPEDYLSRDERLVKTMTALSGCFSIGAVTNNTSHIALRTLDVLGIRSFFQVVIGLDRSREVKPSMVPFGLAAQEMGLDIAELVSVGDRMEVDIELPVSSGMGGILVESMEDVYSLPEILNTGQQG